MTKDTEDERQPLTATRRAMLHGALGAGTLGSLAALGATPALAAEGGEGNFPKHKKWKFTFVNHVTTNPFFVPTQYGIADACALLGCTYQWTGLAEIDRLGDGERHEHGDCRQGRRHRGLPCRPARVQRSQSTGPSRPASRCSPTTPTPRATTASPISGRISTMPARRSASGS